MLMPKYLFTGIQNKKAQDFFQVKNVDIFSFFFMNTFIVVSLEVLNETLPKKHLVTFFQLKPTYVLVQNQLF